jgi:hypothetical protein
LVAIKVADFLLISLSRLLANPLRALYSTLTITTDHENKPIQISKMATKHLKVMKVDHSQNTVSNIPKITVNIQHKCGVA